MPDEIPGYFNNGCLIDDCIFIPLWNARDDVGLKAYIEVWAVPTHVNGNVKLLATFEVMMPDDTPPNERAFHLTPAQDNVYPTNGQRGFYPVQAILSVWIGSLSLELYVPIATFLQEGDIYGDNYGQRAPVIRWEAWEPKRAYIVAGSRHIGVAGLRVFYSEMIADLNRYDMEEDIYGYEPRPGPRGGRGRVDESYLSEGLLGAPDLCFPEFGERPAHRVVPFRRKGTSLFFIEEDDDPKVSLTRTPSLAQPLLNIPFLDCRS